MWGPDGIPLVNGVPINKGPNQKKSFYFQVKA
jgi:hypothetical protein